MKHLFGITLAIAQTLAACSAQTGVSAASLNWPQWRGPLANGVAPAADPPLTWSETNHVKWKAKLPGRGTSTPIVWSNVVFIQTAVPAAQADAAAADPNANANANTSTNAASAASVGGTRGGGAGPGGGRGSLSSPPKAAQEFVLLAIDRRTGQTLWRRTVRQELPHEGHHPDHGFASHSPCTDGRQVYAFFGSRGLHCFDLEGNLKWAKDLGRMKIKMSFGEGCSPALADHTLVVNWDHEGEDFIAAFDTATGREKWRQAREEDTSWATPLIVRHDGQTQVVTAATRKIRAYDFDTGTPIWEATGMTANVIPTPVADEGMVFPISGFRGSALLAIRLGKTGDLTGTDAIAWTYKKNTPYVPSPLLYAGRLYFFSGNEAKLTCLDAKSGKVLIDAQKVDGLQGVYASPVGAAGRVYLVGRNGTAVVIKLADRYEVLATNVLDERIDASPAAVGNQLFLRGQESLYCLEGAE